jgi:hypothetical protein
MNDAVSAVSVLRRRIAGVLFARQWLVYAAFAFLLGGVALLVAKRWSIALPLWPGLLLLSITIFAAAWRASRQLPSRATTVALLDAQAHCGGLLMAHEAIDVGAWRPSVDAIPRVAWRARRQTILTGICAAFLVVAAIVPARAKTTRHSLAIDADVEKLAARIELLEEESILPAERAEAMQAALEDLKRDAEGDDPAKTWETLDSLDEATLRDSEEAASDAVQKAEELTKTEATALAMTDGGLDPETLAAAMNDPEAQKAIGDKALSSDQLRELAMNAKAQKSKLRGTLSKLSKNGLIDPKKLGEFDEASKLGEKRELEKFLKECKNGKRFSDALGEWMRAKPSVSRGRGDAPMFFGEEAAQNGKFKEEALPPANAAALANSELLAVSAAEPSEQDGERSTPGALRDAKAGGGSALTPVVQPRHRGAVNRYFERKPK